jgi:hypothetical protein
MRKALVLALVTLTLAVGLGSTPANASVVRRFYAGTTSAGGEIMFTTLSGDGRTRLREVNLDADLVCADGTTLSFSGGFGFDGPVLNAGTFDFDLRSFADAIIASGRLGSRAGSRTIRQLTAALDADEQPQVCDTGDLTWTVERTDRPTFPSGADTVQTIRAGGITRTLALSRPGERDAPSDRVAAVRSYDGRISSDGRLSVTTVRRGRETDLAEFGIGWALACDDGSTVGLGLFILFAPGETLEPGRLDLDEIDQTEALHVHGRLGPHAGDGAASMIMPALTTDLQAQGCRSGERTWRAWRTDAGAIRL